MKFLATALFIACATLPGWAQSVAAAPQKKAFAVNGAVLFGPKGDAFSALEVAPGMWWTNDALVKQLGLTIEQQKRMEGIFQQSRLRLIDLNAALQKEELLLEPLVAADVLDEGRIVAQIDRIAQARAELEKANARMLLGLRQSLTPEQWSRLPKFNLKKKGPFRGQTTQSPN